MVLITRLGYSAIPPGHNPQSNEVNLTENNITIPPDGFSYDATLVLDLSEYNEDNPGDVYAYAVYTITLERKYRIKSEADWNTFCDRLGDNGSYNRFSGDTLYLEDDITVSRPAGYNQHDFCGAFDGQGHTLTFNYSGSVEYAAPFSFVSVAVPLGSEEGTPNSPVTIKNLNVKSTIRSSGKHAAGLIGQCWGEVNVENCTMDIDIDTGKDYSAGYVGKNNANLSFTGCTVGGTIKTSAKDAAGFVAEISGECNITDCLSGLTINSSVSGDGTHGGFVGVQNRATSNNITMKGCVFNGSLLGADTTGCGGFVGWRRKNLTISDSIFAPAEVTVGNDNSAMLAREGTTAVSNSYYLYALGGDAADDGKQGKQGYFVTAGAAVTLRDADITGLGNKELAGITLLGDATVLIEGTNAVKGGYEEYPGIFVPENHTLTIDGDGSLDVSSEGSSAIGGIYNFDTPGGSGNIVIKGSTITAVGGAYCAAIGSTCFKSCGTITISGGTINATGGENGAGIGSGAESSCADITITKDVVHVTAIKGGNAQAIGSGASGTCGTITI
ncbi:MAG: hypothetical protein ABS876_08130, partial [Ruminococcus sp.]